MFRNLLSMTLVGFCPNFANTFFKTVPCYFIKLQHVGFKATGQAPWATSCVWAPSHWGLQLGLQKQRRGKHWLNCCSNFGNCVLPQQGRIGTCKMIDCRHYESFARIVSLVNCLKNFCIVNFAVLKWLYTSSWGGIILRCKLQRAQFIETGLTLCLVRIKISVKEEDWGQGLGTSSKT